MSSVTVTSPFVLERQIRSYTGPYLLSRVLEAETRAPLQQTDVRYYGHHHDYVYMRLLLKDGLFPPEEMSIRPEYVDLVRTRLTVHEGKRPKDWTVWMGDDLLEELREPIGRRKADAWS